MSKEAFLNPERISEWFWRVIASGKDEEAIAQILNDLPDEEVLRFALEHRLAGDLLHDDRFVAEMSYKSEDDIDDTSYWVVSQGKEFYLSVWNDPRVLNAYPEVEGNDPPTLEGLAEGVLMERHGEWPNVIEEYEAFCAGKYFSVDDYRSRLGRPPR